MAPRGQVGRDDRLGGGLGGHGAWRACGGEETAKVMDYILYDAVEMSSFKDTRPPIRGSVYSDGAPV